MAKKTIWQRIKGWFTGEDKKKKKATPPATRVTMNEVRAQSNSPRRAYIDTIRGKDVKDEMRSLNSAYKAKKFDYADMTESIDNNLKVTPPTSKTTSKLPSVDKRLANTVRKSEAKDSKNISAPSTGQRSRQWKVKTEAEDAGKRLTEYYKSQGDKVSAYQNVKTKKYTPPEPDVHKVTIDTSHDDELVWGNESELKAYKAVRKWLENQQKLEKELHEQTDHRYDVKYWEALGDEQRAEEARIRVRNGEMATDPVAERLAIKYNPKAVSAARGGLSAVTFGGSDYIIGKQTGERAENEKYYQENKSEGAELVGEFLGSLAMFGITNSWAEAKAMQALERFAPNLVGNLAKKRLIQGTATRAVNRMVRKGIFEEATEELIEAVGKKKAAQILRLVGGDIIQNATIGTAYDVSRASKQYKSFSEDWWKEMGRSALLNLAASGAVAGGSMLRAGNDVVLEGANDLARRALVTRGAQRMVAGDPNYAFNGRMFGESIEDRIARVDAEQASKKAIEDTLISEPPTPTKAIEDTLINEPPASATVKDASETSLEKALVESDTFDGLVRANSDNPAARAFVNENGIDGLREAWRDARINSGKQSLHRISREEADNIIEESLPEHIRFEWFTNENSNVKPLIVESLAENPRAINASLNKAYDNYLEMMWRESKTTLSFQEWLKSNPNVRSFDDWLDTPWTLYRGTYGQAKTSDDIFSAFSPDIKIAEKYAGKSAGAQVDAVSVKPRDTYGSFDNNGDLEVLVPERYTRAAKVTEENAERSVKAAERTKNSKPIEPPKRAEKPKPSAKKATKATVAEATGGDRSADDIIDIQKKYQERWNELDGKVRNSKGKAQEKAREELRKFEKTKPEFSLTTTERKALQKKKRELVKKAKELPEGSWDRAEIEEEIKRIDGIIKQADKTQKALIRKTEREAQKRVKEIAKGEEPTTKITAEPEPSGDKNLPIGVRKARAQYEKISGEELKKGAEAPTTKEIYEAHKGYYVSQGTNDRIKQSKAAATQIHGMSSEAEKALRRELVESGGYDYNTIYTPELYDQISQEFKVNGDYWVKRVLDGADDVDTITVKEAPFMQARAEYLLACLDPQSNPEVRDAYVAALKLTKEISSKSGQVLNIRRNFVKLSRGGRIDSVMDDLAKFVTDSAGFEKAFPELKTIKGKFNRINYIKGVLMDDPEIEKAVTRLAEARTVDDVAEAYTEAMYALNKNNPKTVFDVIQEWRYFNMLANPKTHIRNVMGSGFFAPIRQTSNMVRSWIESPIADKAGLDIVKHGGWSLSAMKDCWTDAPVTKAGKAAQEAFERRAADILGGEKFGMPMYAGRAKTLVGKGMDAASDFNSKMLTLEDDFFRKRAFKENYIKSYNRYLKDKVPMTDRLLRRIEDEAITESQIATFNEYNEFANWLTKITRNANNPNATIGARWGGRFVNAMLPFEKVPANLMKQSINYSPIGLAKGYLNIRKAIERSDAVALNRAIDELASGATGTAIFALGAMLGLTTNAFTTNAGKDDPAAKFKKQQGVQNYSVTVTIDGKKYSLTLDWLVPTSAVFFAGVEMANQAKTNNLSFKSIRDSVIDWATVSSRLIEPVMETSMLSGLHSVLETMRGGYGDDDQLGAGAIILRETAQNWIGSLFPTLGGQLARTFYKSDKQLPSAGDWGYFGNTLKLKTGLAGDNAVTRALGIEPLGADTDAYGNVKGQKQTAGDYLTSFLKNSLSPANIQRVDLSELDEQKLAEYERRVKAGEDPNELAYLFPKKQSKKEFKLAGEMISMSNNELSLFNQAKTTGGEEGMRYVLDNSIIFNRYDYDENGKKVPSAQAYTEAQKAALMRQFKGKSLREVEEWLYAQPEFQNATPAEQKKVITGLWTLTKDTNANAAQRVGGQAVFEAQGRDVNEYNYLNEVSESKRAALQPYIDNGTLTYEDVVNFERYAGKMRYTESDDGGSSQMNYTKASMMEYLASEGVPYDVAEALYNAYKAPNAKAFNGIDLSSGSGKGRRRYGGYHRSGGGGHRKRKAPAIKKSNYRASSKTYKDIASTLKTRSSSIGASSLQNVKVEPPKVKFKKYEV